MNRAALILILFLTIQTGLVCQETNYGPGFQTLMSVNPAFAGCSYNGILRLEYLNFYPGNNYNFHSFYLSYDSYVEALHGGAGFYVSNDYLGGIVNEIRSGLSYSYFLQAGKELFINAGLSASLFNRSFSFSNAIFPDQIDQMGVISYPSSETITDGSTSVIDVNTGVMVFYRNMEAGFAVSHLTQPDLSRNGSFYEPLERKYLFHFLARISLNEKNGLNLLPLFFAEKQGNFLGASAGALVESSHFSVNALLLMNNYRKIDVQTGFSLRKDKLAIFYNYRFNISSENSILPFSLSHQAGINLILNNVEKSIKGRTINVPDM